MEEKTTLGKFISRKRKEVNLTQKQLAEKLYVTESAVSKWERGVSYPDISLVSNICNALNVTEHELITASEDFKQRKIEKQAKTLTTVIKTYSWTFYLAYGISLIACFITNFAIDKTLSWFFIVLSAEMVAFSLTSLPLILQKHKGIITLLSFFVSLNLLLLICCVYTKGDWFFLTFVSLLFSFTVIFLPIILNAVHYKNEKLKHKSLICITADTILLFLQLAVSLSYSGNVGQFLETACPIALFCITLPWLILITIRYVKVNDLFKTSICLLISGTFVLLINSVLDFILEKKPFELISFNIKKWNSANINDNVIIIIVLSCIATSILFAIGGIVLTIKSKTHKITTTSN